MIVFMLGVGTKTMENDLIDRLRKRAEIRRQISSRKSVQNNEPDRLADLLEEAATVLHQQQAEIETLKYWQDTWRPFLKKHFGVESCNGFCGEQECKENQANCKRIKK